MSKNKDEKNQERRAKRKKKGSTSVKLTTIGKADYINSNTGEVETFNVIEEKDQDFNFEKIWLGHLLTSLDIIGNKKMLVLNWLLANKDSENKIIGTQRVIAEKAKVSLPVVNETIKALVNANAIKKMQTGVFMLNPELVFKGRHSKRMNILLRYTEIETIDQEPEKEKNLLDKGEENNE